MSFHRRNDPQALELAQRHGQSPSGKRVRWRAIDHDRAFGHAAVRSVISDRPTCARGYHLDKFASLAVVVGSIPPVVAHGPPGKIPHLRQLRRVHAGLIRIRQGIGFARVPLAKMGIQFQRLQSRDLVAAHRHIGCVNPCLRRICRRRPTDRVACADGYASADKHQTHDVQAVSWHRIFSLFPCAEIP